MQIIFGALENPQALLAHCMILLAERDDLQNLLRANPDKVPGFVMESLRYFNVAMGVARTARSDTEARRGARSARAIAYSCRSRSGNLDPAKFDHPDKFDLDRPAAQNFAMGAGSHTCLGQFLVHVMLTELIRALLRRVEVVHDRPRQGDQERGQVRKRQLRQGPDAGRCAARIEHRHVALHLLRGTTW